MVTHVLPSFLFALAREKLRLKSTTLRQRGQLEFAVFLMASKHPSHVIKWLHGTKTTVATFAKQIAHSGVPLSLKVAKRLILV